MNPRKGFEKNQANRAKRLSAGLGIKVNNTRWVPLEKEMKTDGGTRKQGNYIQEVRLKYATVF